MPNKLIISACCQAVQKAETFKIYCSPQRPCEGSGGHLQCCLSLGSLHHVGPWEKKQYEHEYVLQCFRHCSHDFTVPVHWTVSNDILHCSFIVITPGFVMYDLQLQTNLCSTTIGSNTKAGWHQNHHYRTWRSRTAPITIPGGSDVGKSFMLCTTKSTWFQTFLLGHSFIPTNHLAGF